LKIINNEKKIMKQKQIKKFQINYTQISLLMAGDPLEVAQTQDESYVEIVGNHEFDLKEVKKVVFPVLVFGMVMFMPMPSYARLVLLKGSRNKVTVQASQPEVMAEIEKDSWLEYLNSWLSITAWKKFLRICIQTPYSLKRRRCLCLFFHQ
jgi:hypothetical protein